MARLGTLMNLLFREIGDARKAPALVQATREMDALLAHAAGFRPDSAAFTPDAQSEAAVMRGFRACLQRAREALARLREALPVAQEGEARQRLLELDRLRRRCHAAFG
ncbi:MAG: hypothetical protein D6773_06520 [Alphaproteobacteria bacterium]|nr:MAG: hypothetical protein D6773_06520 [Alphaproteobacteria bacterium]